MTPTRRYFLACDLLDNAERQGHPKRISRLLAIVDKLRDESADALVNEVDRLTDNLKADIRRMTMARITA